MPISWGHILTRFGGEPPENKTRGLDSESTLSRTPCTCRVQLQETACQQAAEMQREGYIIFIKT